MEQVAGNAHPQPSPVALLGPQSQRRIYGAQKSRSRSAESSGTVLWKNYHGLHGGSLLLLKGRGAGWHPRGSGCCGCRESREMPAWLLTVPCPPPRTRWQGTARGTVETPAGEVAGGARR